FLGRAAGRHLHALALNLDPRPVDVHRRRRSIGSQRALGRRERTATELDVILAGIIDRLGRRLRAAHRVCRTVVLRLRFDDFTRATRSHTLAEATAHTETILFTARGLLVAVWPVIAERGLTLLGVSLAELHDDQFVQLALPFDPHSGPVLDRTLDTVRDRFGAQSLTRATQLGRSPGLIVPQLPD
ncbi:MAG TPA: DNA polymerase IV, partial [Pseudonocardia sp.]|nr:DNA polymerase IV [Pseudonocardia sp.]